MGVAFELRTARSRVLYAWGAASLGIGVSGLALSAWHLGSGPTWLLDDPGPAATFMPMAALGLLAWGLRSLPGRALGWVPHGSRLRVDEDGLPSLALEAERRAVPMSLHACGAIGGLSWLVLAPYAAQPRRWGVARTRTLVLGRDAVPADAWRRLHVWLRWCERGRHGARPSGPDPT
jgi:hypothetical protein